MNECEHCNRRFASEWALYDHRRKDACIEVETDLRWHVNGAGEWTNQPHRASQWLTEPMVQRRWR